MFSLDEEILRELAPWREQFQYISDQIVATTDITLDHRNCLYAECLMGNIVTDAFLTSYRRMTNDTKPAIALVQSGGIRVTLPSGR